MPGHALERGARCPPSVSRSSVVVNWATCSARNTDHSRSGSVRRAATTARHIGHVPCTCSRGSGGERHAAAAEGAEAAGHALGRVAAALVLAAVLGEADHHEPPAQLVAVAPVQHGRGAGDADHAQGQPGSEKCRISITYRRLASRFRRRRHLASPGPMTYQPDTAPRVGALSARSRPGPTTARCAPGSRRRWRPSLATTAARSWPPRRPPPARPPSACASRTGCSRRAASAASR